MTTPLIQQLAWEEAWEETNAVAMPDIFAGSGIANARWGFEAGWEARGIASRSEMAEAERAVVELRILDDYGTCETTAADAKTLAPWLGARDADVALRAKRAVLEELRQLADRYQHDEHNVWDQCVRDAFDDTRAKYAAAELREG